VALLRLLLAWSFTALGVLNLLMGIDDLPYLIFHVVLLGSGVVLLALGLFTRRPRLPAYLTGVAVAALGLLVSSLPSTSAAVCCLDGSDPHGFPFTLLANVSGHRRLDLGHGIADLLFWSCLGLFALLVVTLITPERRPGHGHPAGQQAHAERRADIADDENVGGLP
jgi:hypothetical protein